VISRLHAELERWRMEVDLEPIEGYRNRFAQPGRYDSADVVYIKNMLQHGLPQPVRQDIVQALFDRFVGVSERALADELYMTVEQVQMLVQAGMHVGSHSATHRWLNRIPPAEQAEEVDRSLEFLEHLGINVQNGWTMCYPYGGHDASLRSILRDRSCTIGHTIEVDIAQLNTDDPLALPRLDTNDLPKDAEAAPNRWARAMQPANERPAKEQPAKEQLAKEQPHAA